MNLYIVSVDLINGLYPIVLDVLSLIAIFSGVLVITTKNPVKRFGKPLLLWDKLSNSGDSLKLLIPSKSGNTLCGWINYSCMVISQKIIENEMGYRGSKSDFITFIAHLFSYVILGFTPSETTDLFSFMAAHSFLLSAVAPLVVYKNSGLTKPGILKDNKGKSGISRRVNKEAGKVMLSVKEQRVDGSWYGGLAPSKIRCTLIGFFLNYRVKILTRANHPSFFSFPAQRSIISIPKVKNKNRSFPSFFFKGSELVKKLASIAAQSKIKLHPSFVTGFTDAEWFFSISRSETET